MTERKKGESFEDWVNRLIPEFGDEVYARGKTVGAIKGMREGFRWANADRGRTEADLEEMIKIRFPKEFAK